MARLKLIGAEDFADIEVEVTGEQIAFALRQVPP